MEGLTNKEFSREKHIKYFLRCLQCLPIPYSSLDTSRMTVLFFCLSGLDLLNALERIKNEHQNIINWIYSLQILPKNDESNTTKCGFRGSPFLGSKYQTEGSFSVSELYESSHIAMTYTALCSLIILGDDLSRVNRNAIINGIKFLQKEDGSFYSTQDKNENDMRFLYCACCISYILQDWNGLDKTSAVNYIRMSMSYDYGLSQGPQLEAHGGSTYCGVASLILMDKLEECFNEKEIKFLKRWCLKRQKSGFQGRPNKPVDTCYSFWVGASLKMLDFLKYSNFESNNEFIISTQDTIVGGFSKWPDVHPDVMHSYLGLCGLSLMQLYNLSPLFPALNISERAYQHLRKIQTE
ncbi:geranylgeranyl transferase type-1 subunit beta isoform X1 [Hydra vulgaris]|uniref:Geranylgeranyl transferase type-1 subunit beta n=1 Tax=Hydra vulgaris TaxID=6087 RepID=T2MFL1_HYDVU|nr:geranylgeranyl transferase type-1 subunit beta [Hydra vulgaris]